MQILKSYTLDDCEASIKPAFVEKLTVKLNARPNKVNENHSQLILFCDQFNFLLSFVQTSTDTFTMDEAFVHPLKVIYKYDSTRLEEIELPQILNLDSILTRI